MKMQQELMRHASIQTTMNVYGQAMTDGKRHANSQVVSLVFCVPNQTVEGSVAIQQVWGVLGPFPNGVKRGLAGKSYSTVTY